MYQAMGITAPTWNSNSTEFAFEQSYCAPGQDCTPRNGETWASRTSKAAPAGA
ncbi:hypothetical protein LP420_39770 [Massilia sp. B-10]|nr:hypothetical protein LP420_39770 [Massilia sp. B-10]